MLTQTRHLLYLPLDARPVCLQTPQYLARVVGITLHSPPEHLLGALKTPANRDALRQWMLHTRQQVPELEAAIIALDMPLYGGLIPGRLGHEPVQQLRACLELCYTDLAGVPIYGFASVMRIPNYNNAEEEPDYWANFGSRLHAYSYGVHEAAVQGQPFNASAFEDIPAAVLNDFLHRRERNHGLARQLLHDLQAGQLKRLVYCEDDRGAFGLNVQEATVLKRLITKMHQEELAHVQTGADEVSHTLLVRAIRDIMQPDAITPLPVVVACAQNRDAHAKFDGVSVHTALQQRFNAVGLVESSGWEDAAFVVVLHAPHVKMGDHCELQPADTTQTDAEQTMVLLEKARAFNKPVALLDVAYANGGDPHLLKALAEHPEMVQALLAYGAWNTPGNAMGCALAFATAAVVNPGHADARKEAVLLRLLDDGVYQARVRGQWREQGLPLDDDALTDAMRESGHVFLDAFDIPAKQLKASFPCQRTFECALRID
jgi:hypothetical protein